MLKSVRVIGLLIVGLAAVACASSSPVATAASSTSADASASLPAPESSSAAAGSSVVQAPAGATKTCVYSPDGATPAKAATPPPAAERASGIVTATLSIGSGQIEIKMDRSKTPCTVGSFVHLAEAGYFNATPCHRLTASSSLSVLQCGDPSGTGGGGPGYAFDDETTPDMTYSTGTVAMANAGPNTNGSQFFLVYADSTLPPSYTVFGTIVGGMDTLTQIAKAGISGGASDGAPANPVTISKVVVA